MSQLVSYCDSLLLQFRIPSVENWGAMLSETTSGQLLKLKKYDRIAIYLFRRLVKGYTSSTIPNELPFTLQDVRDAMHDVVADGLLKKVVKNVADIKYTYDARKNFPPEMEQAGPLTWLQVSKGNYKFVKTQRRNLIILPDSLLGIPITEEIPDQTPKFINDMLGDDEQAVFTRVRNAGVISTFLGFQAMVIQGHHRTTVSYGQIEIDEVQAGIEGTQGTIVPISGKGGQDKLSWSQALNLNTYGTQKSRIPHLAIKSLGLWRDDEKTVWVVQFTPHTDIHSIDIVKARRFKFV